MSRESSTFPHQTILLRQQRRYLPAHQLIANGLLGIRVQLVRIRHLPRPTRVPIIITHRLDRVRELRLLGVEGITVGVLRRADSAGARDGIDLEDGVLVAVDLRVDAQTEQVLMVVGVDASVDFGAPALGVFAFVHGVRVEDTSQLDLELDGAVLVQDPVDAVFVVGSREDLRDDEFAAASHDDGFVAEISVLE